jgi:hypothetical protein
VTNVNLSFGNADIVIYRMDGKIPHFHIISESVESSLCIFDKAYYNHDKNYVKLSKEDLNTINSFLQSKVKESTVWDNIRSTWCFVAEIKYEYKDNCMNISQPDYTQILDNDRYIRRSII